MNLTSNGSSGAVHALNSLSNALSICKVQNFQGQSLGIDKKQSTAPLLLPYFIECLQVCIVIVFFIELKQAYIRFSTKAPLKVHIVGPPTLAGRWLTGLFSGWRGNDMMHWGYEKTKARTGSFAIPTLGRYIVLVTSQGQYEEINCASAHALSLGGLVKDRIFPEVIMEGLIESDYDAASGNNQYILKRRLRSRLPILHETLREGAEESITVAFGNLGEDWKEIHMYSSLVKMFMNLNNYVLVGKDLAHKPGYLDASLHWAEHATMTEELLQFLPNFLAPCANKIFHWRQSKANILSFLLPEAEKRLEQRRAGVAPVGNERQNAISWMSEKMSHRSPLCIAGHTMALTFAGTHQPPMLLMFTLYNLCKYPEYIEPLRQEAQQAEEWMYDGQNTEMPLIDSFIKETARLEPGSLIGVGRRVNSDFTFKDGTRVPAGNFVGIHHAQTQRNQHSYRNPEGFDGFRFVSERGSCSRLTHGSWDFTFWGSTRLGCPARFYVSVAMKLFLTHLLLNYDIKLADAKASSSWNLGFMRFPNPRQNLLIRRRKC